MMVVMMMIVITGHGCKRGISGREGGKRGYWGTGGMA
jgi:hypothetical protein